MPEKKAIRFCVGTPGGARSAVWRLWATKNDVYLFFREVSDEVKVSLHETGEWQLAITHDYVMRTDNPALVDGGRFFEKWNRPAERRPGVTIAMRLLIPSTAVNIPPGVQGEPPDEQGNRRRETRLVAPPPSGWYTVVTVAFTNQQMTERWPGRSQGTKPIGQLRLPNGEQVWLVAHETETIPLTQDPADLEEQVRQTTAQIASGRNIHLASLPWPRIFLFGALEDGARVLVDVPVTVTRAGPNAPPLNVLEE
jgi:hypothetical protein